MLDPREELFVNQYVSGLKQVNVDSDINKARELWLQSFFSAEELDEIKAIVAQGDLNRAIRFFLLWSENRAGVVRPVSNANYSGQQSRTNNPPFGAGPAGVNVPGGPTFGSTNNLQGVGEHLGRATEPLEVPGVRFNKTIATSGTPNDGPVNVPNVPSVSNTSPFTSEPVPHPENPALNSSVKKPVIP